MPRCNRFLASVRVGRKALEEYAVDGNDDSVTSWIASEEGQVFDVTWGVEERGVIYSAYLEVEGIPISRRIHDESERTKRHLWHGKRISDSEVRPFQFARVSVTDDETQALRTSSNLTRSIVIRIYRTKKRERTEQREGRPSFIPDGFDLDANGEVFEKAKLLNPHMISYGQEPVQRFLHYYKAFYQRTDSMDKPFFTFKFLYGPKEYLLAQEIIPKDKEGIHRPLLPDDDENAAALRDLERRKEEAQRQQAELQSEIDRLKGSGGVTVKREAKSDISFGVGDVTVIDLTDD